MNILIRDLPPEIVKRLDILSAIAGLTRAEYIRQLLDRDAGRLALERVSEAITTQTE